MKDPPSDGTYSTDSLIVVLIGNPHVLAGAVCSAP